MPPQVSQITVYCFVFVFSIVVTEGIQLLDLGVVLLKQ